jgi:hypothetical protein
MMAFAADKFTVQGDAQITWLPTRATVPTNSPVAVTSDVGASSTTNQYTLPNNSSFLIFGEAVARDASGNSAAYSYSVLIKRGANAAATSIVGSPSVTTLYNDASAASWVLAIVADTTNGGLKVNATSAAGVPIHVVQRQRAVEAVF